MRAVRKVLYRLPELRPAIDAGKPIYVAEGEKDCDALAAAGVIATTWPDGAWRKGMSSKWQQSYTESIAGAKVIIVRDKDEAGHYTADTIAKSIGYKMASVTIVEAAVGKDAYDHLAAGKRVDEFIPEGDAQQLGRGARITWAKDIVMRPPLWAWIDNGKGRIPSGSLTVAAGRESTGKSTFGVWMAAQITRGTLPGNLYGKPRRVLYVAVEDSWEHTLAPRRRGAGGGYGNGSSNRTCSMPPNSARPRLAGARSSSDGARARLNSASR